jgi:hypothetical protein
MGRKIASGKPVSLAASVDRDAGAGGKILDPE